MDAGKKEISDLLHKRCNQLQLENQTDFSKYEF